MIHHAMKQVADELNAYLSLVGSTGSGDPVVAGSLFDLDGNPNTAVRDKIAMTVVNVQRDPVYRPIETFRDDPAGHKVRVRPEVKINLYVLFVANMDEYEEALKAIARVVSFFQNQNTFGYNDSGASELQGRVALELHSLTFEQQNHLWASIGAKYLPSVVYKAGIINVRDARIDAIVAPVQDISATGRMP